MQPLLVHDDPLIGACAVGHLQVFDWLRNILTLAVVCLTNLNAAQASPEVPNDNFEDRIMLSGLPVTTAGPVLPASLEPCESRSTESWIRVRSVWWSWIAPSNGTYAAVVSSPAGSVVVGVFCGTNICSLSPWAAEAIPHLATVDGEVRRCVQANFTAVGGSVYHVMVDADWAGPTNIHLSITLPPAGQFNTPTNRAEIAHREPVLLSADAHDPDGFIQTVDYLQWYIFDDWGFAEHIGLATNAPWTSEWSSVATGIYPIVARLTDCLGAQTTFTNQVWIGVRRPPNDDFAQRLFIPGTLSSVSVAGSNYWASVEPGEVGPDRSIWWSWTAPASELVTLTDDGSSIDAHLSVYTGSSLTNLSRIVQGISTEVTMVSFASLPGTTYQIRAAGQPGDIILNLTRGPIPILQGSFGGEPGTFVLDFDGIPGQHMLLEGSTNLMNWVLLQLGLYGQPIHYVDHQATNLDHRFYRVSPWP